MVKLILFALLIVVFVYLMYQSQRMETSLRRQGAQDEADGTWVQQYSERGKQLWHGLQLQIQPEGPQSVNPAKFSKWAKGSPITDQKTELWVESLNEENWATVAEFSADFCHNMGFELNWLIEDRLPDDLDETLTQVVIRYLESCRLILDERQRITEFSANDTTKMPTLPTDEARHHHNGHLNGKAYVNGSSNMSLG